MNNEQFEQRLSAIEYELSQIAESEYLEELKEKFSGDYGKDVVVNIIPLRDISFKTRSLLSSILDRLELSKQDRLDLEKYIVYGGGYNIKLEDINNNILELSEKVKKVDELENRIKELENKLN